MSLTIKINGGKIARAVEEFNFAFSPGLHISAKGADLAVLTESNLLIYAADLTDDRAVRGALRAVKREIKYRSEPVRP